MHPEPRDRQYFKLGLETREAVKMLQNPLHIFPVAHSS